jgi:hypothetical protein
MKLCKDCKHFNEHPPGTISPLCVHPSAPRDRVYGFFNFSCSMMRSEGRLVDPACGPAGEWFEQREPEPPTHQSNELQNSPYLGGHAHSWAPSDPASMDPACDQRRSWWQRIFGA